VIFSDIILTFFLSFWCSL